MKNDRYLCRVKFLRSVLFYCIVSGLFALYPGESIFAADAVVKKVSYFTQGSIAGKYNPAMEDCLLKSSGFRPVIVSHCEKIYADKSPVAGYQNKSSCFAIRPSWVYRNNNGYLYALKIIFPHHNHW